MVPRQRWLVEIPIHTFGPKVSLIPIELLLAAWGDGGDLDAWAFEGLGGPTCTSSTSTGGLIAGLKGLVKRLQCRRSRDELGVRLDSMPMVT